MEDSGHKNIVSIVTLLLLIVVTLLLFKLSSKIKSIEKDLKAQGEKVAILYDVVDAELDLNNRKDYIEREKRDNELGREVALETINEFRNPQFQSKAKFNPKNNTFAVILGDGSVQIYDAENSDLIQTLRNPGEFATAIAYLPDGEKLVIGTESGKLFLWDLKGGVSEFLKQVAELKIARLDAGENNRLAVGIGGSPEESKKNNFGMIIDISTGEVISEHSAFFREDFQGLAISSDGSIFASRDVTDKERGAVLFDASNGTELRMLYHRKYGCGPLSVAIAPDNSTVAVGYAPYHVIVWDGKDGAVKSLLEGHSNWVVSLDFSDDNRFLASGAGDSTARVYSLEDGKEVGRVRFVGSSTYIESVDISADGKLLLAAVNNYVGIYKMPQ